jgi:lysophospholipase L1-like esterase
MYIFLRILLVVALGAYQRNLLFQDIAPAATAASSDFAQLERYKEANREVLSSLFPARVVFLGDSTMEHWGSRNGKWFPIPGWINRKIGGQTTAQMLLRGRADVLQLRPAAVVIGGRRDDMRLGFEPEAIRDNVLSAAELAEANGLKVFVAKLTPVCDCFQEISGLRTVQRIQQLNLLLAAMCSQRQWVLLDLNTPLADSSGHMRQEFTADGVHPNDAGYAHIAPVIDEALGKFR